LLSIFAQTVSWFIPRAMLSRSFGCNSISSIHRSLMRGRAIGCRPITERGHPARHRAKRAQLSSTRELFALRAQCGQDVRAPVGQSTFASLESKI
jgi:hypothetical protein